MWIDICRKNTKFIAIRCVCQVPDAPKPVFGQGSAPNPCGGVYDTPPDSYSRAEIPILWVFQLSVSPPKEPEARQTCPGFFLKSLLKSPGNLLD